MDGHTVCVSQIRRSNIFRFSGLGIHSLPTVFFSRSAKNPAFFERRLKRIDRLSVPACSIIAEEKKHVRVLCHK